jgi:hypothetical protein
VAQNELAIQATSIITQRFDNMLPKLSHVAILKQLLNVRRGVAEPYNN